VRRELFYGTKYLTYDEKAGFKYEGTLRKVILRFGKYNDLHVYSLLKSEYLQNITSDK